MKPAPPASRKKQALYPADLLFVLLVLAFAFAAWQGILQMSENGAALDSDLQTYAQGMAGEAHPELFANDPVLKTASPANSIPNLQRALAGLMLKDDSFAAALLGAGAIAIFVFYAGWYLFGRIVFHYPSLAALLSLTMGITVWIGWGTFWGALHSDPVPRVFFAAILPFLLLLAVRAVQKPLLRPLAMLACGLCMWVHGISALNCGAMFFMAFFFLKSPGASWRAHFISLCACLVFFLAPVSYFLWPSLGLGKTFSADELALFKELFDARWQKDYSDFSSRLLSFLKPSSPPFLILCCGAGSWLAIRRISSGPLRELCRMIPCFILALAMVTAFCWAEGRAVPALGRLPAGHELIRGLRFCAPLSWIMITGLFALFLPKIFWRASLAALIAGLLLFSADRQLAAAEYFIYNKTGLSLPLVPMAEAERAKALEARKLAEMIKSRIPQGGVLFSDEDLMLARHSALRPLAYSFKDGYVHYYNKDFPASARWLEIEKIMASPPDALSRAWLVSGAPWLASKSQDADRELAPYAELIDQSGPWRLYKRRQAKTRQNP